MLRLCSYFSLLLQAYSTICTDSVLSWKNHQTRAKITNGTNKVSRQHDHTLLVLPRIVSESKKKLEQYLDSTGGSPDENGSAHNECPETEIIALDGGWGWFIVLASFMMHVIGGYYNQQLGITESEFVIAVWGIDYTFGMFLGEFMETFSTNRTSTSMVASIQMGVTLFVGPVVADLVDKYGCRASAIAGSIIAATNIIISGAAPNIAILYITAGFFTGNLSNFYSWLQSNCLQYIPSDRAGFWLHLPTSRSWCGNLL